MADLSCSFMYFRSLTINHNFSLFLPPNRYYSSPLHSHNSRITIIKRSSPHLLLLFKPSPFSASASDIDVISTHEHSDGSLLFRFGDPSEIKKNEEVEESKAVKEGIEGEENNGLRVVKVVEDDDETEVTEAIDSTDLIVTSSNAVIAVEGQSQLNEKLLESDGSSVVIVVKGDDETKVTGAIDSVDLIVSSSNAVLAVEGGNELSEKILESLEDDELPLLTSNEEIGGISTLDLDIEQNENVEGLNEDFKDSSSVGASLSDESLQIENIATEVEMSYEESREETSSVASSSKETESTSISGVDVGEETVNEEEYADQEDVDSPTDASILDQRSEVVDDITTGALSEKESDDITSADIEADQTGKVEECLNREDEDSTEDESMPDQSSEVEDNISTVALLNMESDGITSADVEADQTGKVEEFLNQEEEDSPGDDSMLDQSSEAVDNVTTVALLEKESDGITSADVEADQTGKVEEFLNQEDEDSPGDESMLDQSSEVVDNVTTVVLSEKESDGITSADVEADQTGKVEEFLNQEDEDSPADESMLDQSSEVVDNNTAVALLEKESDGITSAEADLTGKVVEALKEDYKDSVDDALLDKSSEVVNGISVVDLLEKETDGITYISDTEIEPSGNVEKGISEEYEDSPVDTFVLDKTSEILNNITAEASSEKETADITSAPDIDIEYTGNVERGLDEVHEEPSSMEQGLDEVYEKPSAVEQGLDEVQGVPNAVEQDLDEVHEEPSAVGQVLDESHEEPSALKQGLDESHDEPSAVEQGLDEVHEETSAVEQGLDEVHEEPNAVQQVLDEVHEEPSAVEQDLDEVNEEPRAVEQGLDKVHEEPSAVDASKPDNSITAQDFPGKETADAITLVALKTVPVDAVLDTDSYQGSLESAVTTNLALSEHQNVETAVQDETIGDGRQSLDDNLVSPSPQLESEPAISLYKETEEPNSQNLATEESNETGVSNVKVLEEQKVLGNDNESNIYGAEAESIGSEEQASGSGSGVPDEPVGYVSESDMIQSLTVLPQLEVDSMLEEETGTESMEEPKVDSASENEREGVEASVHEVAAPESAESTITSQETLLTDFVLSSGAALLPHPSKVLTGGEDAYFIAGRTWLGVADGVSQWSLEGTIPGAYAHELIKNCENLISDGNSNSINNPIELLNLSIAQTHSPGSSTVLIAQFDGQALHVANVGDSGFIVIRHGAVYKRSSPMHHVFSLPVHIERGDDPSSLAQLYRVDLEEEDVIVTATDGLLDNLYDKEISLITMKSLADNKSLEEIAELLAKKAQEVGSSASARSPFADDAQAAGFPGYSGGKLDDVVVIVSVVQRR